MCDIIVLANGEDVKIAVSSANRANSVEQCFGMSCVKMFYSDGESTAP